MSVPDWAIHLLVTVPPILGLAWSAVQYRFLTAMDLAGPDNDALDRLLVEKRKERPLQTMLHVADIIQSGAIDFLVIQSKYIVIYVVVFAAIILALFASSEGILVGSATAIAFVAGALTSVLCGFIGMYTATLANVRTAHNCWVGGIDDAFDTALRGGSTIGFGLVSFGILVLYALIAGYSQWDFFNGVNFKMYEAIAGFGLGGSSVALFGRVAGGIYTKAADVGADLSGKNEYGMEEDDIRNPACIADNVGDNVGDIAGMGSDLFGSFAEATCAALLIGAKISDFGNSGNLPAMMYPILISSSGVLVGLVTICAILWLPVFRIAESDDVERTLENVLRISTVLQTPVVIALASLCFPKGATIDDKFVSTWGLAIPVLLGLWSGLFIGKITEYFTSHSYAPVRQISETQRVSAATGIIYGLSLGYMSTIIPVICLAVTVLISHEFCGLYGIALGALGMLSTLTVGLTIDSFGPIADNAGGIAEMSGLDANVRECTDALDAAGNTTAAIGKGFAIGSAALVALALFGAYKERTDIDTVDVSNPWTFAGLLCGAVMPYAFSGMTMKSVGLAAEDMVLECLDQFPGIINDGVEPDYKRCIKISTEASIREAILPGCMVILTPLVGGIIFGKNFTAGLLSGALVSGVPMAISMSNTGGAWDNSKKYIEKGGVEGHPKGSQCHKNAVTGDTVGDPLKDTSGPALNILIKLSAIISLVFGTVIKDWSAISGGPFWLGSAAVLA